MRRRALLADLRFAIVPAVQDRMHYDPEADFVPVTLLAAAPRILFDPGLRR